MTTLIPQEVQQNTWNLLIYPFVFFCFLSTAFYSSRKFLGKAEDKITEKKKKNVYLLLSQYTSSDQSPQSFRRLHLLCIPMQLPFAHLNCTFGMQSEIQVNQLSISHQPLSPSSVVHILMSVPHASTGQRDHLKAFYDLMLLSLFCGTLLTIVLIRH